MPAALGARHPQVARLRALLRDPAYRRTEGRCAVEGPRALGAALERGAEIETVYADEARAGEEVVEAARRRGAEVALVRAGILARTVTTVTSPGVAAVAVRPGPWPLSALDGGGPVLVAVGVADPGNAGTLLRCAEAAGATGVVFCGDSVDPSNPKVVRASAGSLFGVKLVEARVPVEVLTELRAAGRAVLGASAGDGLAYDRAPLAGPVAIVVGSEAHGLDVAARGALTGTVSVPMVAPVESLNVAMAATVLLFEAARQRRALAGLR